MTGCSGFYNNHWKDIFYTAGVPQGNWFEHYAEDLHSLELNVTFYNFPTKAILNVWYDKSPKDFMFSVKVPRIITHYKKLEECHDMLHDFYCVCESALKEKLGCVLFQFPPTFTYTQQNLKLILGSLKPSVQNAVEFRHASWWNKNVYEILDKSDIIFCSSDHPTLPRDIIVNNRVAYVRMHGSPRLFFSEYSYTQLMTLCRTLHYADRLKEAYVFFNNTAETAGILNAQEFNKMACIS